MQRDAELLAALAGYRYDVELMSYVSRDRRRIVTLDFADASETLRERLAASALPDGEWDFCFSGPPPSDAVKREILAKLGVELPPAPMPTLELTVLGAGLMLLWRPATMPEGTDDVRVRFCARDAEGQWQPITRGRFSCKTFAALLAGMPGATVEMEAPAAGKGQV